jgi:hypothetical protein
VIMHPSRTMIRLGLCSSVAPDATLMELFELSVHRGLPLLELRDLDRRHRSREGGNGCGMGRESFGKACWRSSGRSAGFYRSSAPAGAPALPRSGTQRSGTARYWLLDGPTGALRLLLHSRPGAEFGPIPGCVDHRAYTPEGRIGRWFPLIMVAVPAIWLAMAALRDRLANSADRWSHGL